MLVWDIEAVFVLVCVSVCVLDCVVVEDSVALAVMLVVCVADDVADGHVTSNENVPVWSSNPSTSIKYEP